MSVDTPRQTIVEVLDELGEHDQLTYAQRTHSDKPYPSTVVQERLEAIRRGQWEAWGGIGLTGLIAQLVALGVFFGWGMTDFLAGALPGVLVVGGVSVRKLVYYGKAEQLYEVLHQMNDVPFEEVAGSPILEAA